MIICIYKNLDYIQSFTLIIFATKQQFGNTDISGSWLNN